MLRKLMLVAATLVVPTLLAAQDIPNARASDTAKSKVAQRRATRVRGSAVGIENRPVTPASPATPATPSSGGSAAAPASPATPALPAVPASPSQKPTSPGSQAGNRRP